MAVGQRTIEPERGGEASRAIGRSGETDAIERQARIVRRIGINKQIAAKAAAGSAHQAQRGLGQAAAPRRDRAVKRPIKCCPPLPRPAQRHPTVGRERRLRATAGGEAAVGEDEATLGTALHEREIRAELVIVPCPRHGVGKAHRQRGDGGARRRFAESGERFARREADVPARQIALHRRFIALERPRTV